jgi:hypothetical protein
VLLQPCLERFGGAREARRRLCCTVMRRQPLTGLWRSIPHPGVPRHMQETLPRSSPAATSATSAASARAALGALLVELKQHFEAQVLRQRAAHRAARRRPASAALYQCGRSSPATTSSLTLTL